MRFQTRADVEAVCGVAGASGSRRLSMFVLTLVLLTFMPLQDEAQASGSNSAQMIVEPCRNDGYECRESDARPVELCVSYPAGARVTHAVTRTKFTHKQRFEQCDVGSDCAWARFIALGKRGDSQVCTQFVNWSHEYRRVIAIDIEYRP